VLKTNKKNHKKQTNQQTNKQKTKIKTQKNYFFFNGNKLTSKAAILTTWLLW